MYINTFDDTKDDTFSLSYTAAAFDTGSVQVDTTSAVIKQGLWEIVFTCDNITTVGTFATIGEIVVLDPWWQFNFSIIPGGQWEDNKSSVSYGSMGSDDAVTGGSFGSLVSGKTWRVNMRAALPFAVTLRSYYSKFRDGYTIGAVGTWLNG